MSGCVSRDVLLKLDPTYPKSSCSTEDETNGVPRFIQLQRPILRDWIRAMMVGIGIGLGRVPQPHRPSFSAQASGGAVLVDLG